MSGYVWCDNLDHPGDDHLEQPSCLSPTAHPVGESVGAAFNHG